MFDLGIIGAGPGGYSAAIRAAQYGLSVVIFEKEFNGGTCLNRGCIPTKAIIHSAELFDCIKEFSKNGIYVENPKYDFSVIKQKQVKTVEKIRKSLTKLITDYGIKIVEGDAVITSSNSITVNNENYECKNIIIATGSKPNKFKFNGNYNDDFILTSDDILNLDELPNEILIVGSGAIGIEWARIFTMLNKTVKIVELAPKLIPLADDEISERIERICKRKRIEYYTSTTIEKIEGKTVTLSNNKVIDTEKILLAAGRLPVIPKFENSNIEINKYIKVDSNFETTQKGIFAIGDVNGISMLAHSAANQGCQVVEYIKNSVPCKFNRDLIPSVIYGSPEIAWAGESERSLTEKNIQYNKSTYLMAGLGKAQADDKIDGFIKILANNDEIKGIHIIGEEASALLQQVIIMMETGVKVSDAIKIVFPHPTYSEGILETLEGLHGLSINSPRAK